jgi:hypothetical protein
MKPYDDAAMGTLIDKRTAVSKIFGPLKPIIRAEIKANGLPQAARDNQWSEERYVAIEARRRTYNEVKTNDDYAQYRDE